MTHAHADHLCRGCESYLIARDGLSVARARLGDPATIEGLPYGEGLDANGVNVSLHPAGHILGSSQVRLEHRGRVWVASGDYKVDQDPSCATFEPVQCHVFISECTFGLPIYQWPKAGDVLHEMMAWWRNNQAAGRCSLLFAYSLGKAQRVLLGLAGIANPGDGWPGPIFTHGAVEVMNNAYRQQGIVLPATTYATQADRKTDWSQSLVMAPPSAHNTVLDAPVWTGFHGLRLGLDANSRHPPPPGDRPRLRSFRSRGLAPVCWRRSTRPKPRPSSSPTATQPLWLGGCRNKGKNAKTMATRYEGEREEAVEKEET